LAAGEAVAAGVVSHVEKCAKCTERLNELAGDGALIRELREAAETEMVDPQRRRLLAICRRAKRAAEGSS